MPDTLCLLKACEAGVLKGAAGAVLKSEGEA
jgi:hypothetical protein